MTPLDLAKEKLSISDLWQLRGWPGRPGKSCRIPWREDRAPSGSVLADGKLFHDFTSGETLDAPGLLARVEGLTTAAACREFIALAGLAFAISTPSERRSRVRHGTSSSDTRPMMLPSLSMPSQAELRQIAALRAVSVEACTAAAQRGQLFTADWHGARCWLLTDSARRNAQARRIDGEKLRRRDGGTVKALTLPGACASWPIGIAEVGDAERLLLVEGGGDFLAAYHFAYAEGTLEELQPLAMLGASQRIDAGVLVKLAGKRCRIFPHLDAAGSSAALRWETQCREASVNVHCFDLAGLSCEGGDPVGDLNDLARISPDDFEANPALRDLTRF